jgi:hypothetical protein
VRPDTSSELKTIKFGKTIVTSDPAGGLINIIASGRSRAVVVVWHNGDGVFRASGVAERQAECHNHYGRLHLNCGETITLRDHDAN